MAKINRQGFPRNTELLRWSGAILTLTIWTACRCAARASDTAWEGGITAVYQGADDDRVDSEFSASTDLIMILPRSNGEWLLYVEASSTPDANGVSAYYPSANADAGSVLNRDGDFGIQVSELNYTFHLTGYRRLMIGLVNPSAWLDRSRITNDENTHFLNINFKNNATIDFPDYTLGAVMRWLGSESQLEPSVVLASSQGLADLAYRSYRDLLAPSSGRRGVFAGADARWVRDQAWVRLGAWLRSNDNRVADTPNDTEMNYGICGVLGWQVAENAVNVRLGIANDAVSVATRFAAVAYERSTRIGLFGIGVAKTRISNSFRPADLDNVHSAEAFFRIPVGNTSGQLTPSIQYIENPGINPSGATSSSSAVVAGVRFHWSF